MEKLETEIKEMEILKIEAIELKSSTLLSDFSIFVWKTEQKYKK